MTEYNDLERTGKKMATAQFEVRTDWPTPRHISVRDVRVRFEMSSLPPVPFVKQT